MICMGRTEIDGRSPLHPRVRRAGEMVISVQGVGTSLRHTVSLHRESKLNLAQCM